VQLEVHQRRGLETRCTYQLQTDKNVRARGDTTKFNCYSCKMTTNLFLIVNSEIYRQTNRMNECNKEPIILESDKQIVRHALTCASGHEHEHERGS
jgi:hypothetical protein